jgi:hypothetical protein
VTWKALTPTSSLLTAAACHDSSPSMLVQNALLKSWGAVTIQPQKAVSEHYCGSTSRSCSRRDSTSTAPQCYEPLGSLKGAPLVELPSAAMQLQAESFG